MENLKMSIEEVKSFYEHRSMLWALVNEDFSDLTVSQIAEVFDVTDDTVRRNIYKIKNETGFEVKYVKLR